MRPKLDYDTKEPSKRVENVREALDENDWYGGKAGLASMADYMLFANDAKATKRERYSKYPIQTKNRRITQEKRETSLEGLVESLRDSPFSIYDMMSDGRAGFLDARDAITDEDLRKYPELRQCIGVLESLQRQFERSTGRRRYELKRQMIETWQQMYIIRASKNPSRCLSHAKDMARMVIPERVFFDEGGYPASDAMISLFNPAHISFLLENYIALRQETEDDPNSDMWCLLLDLERLVLQTFPHDCELRQILLLKMLSYTNDEIAEKVRRDWGSVHTRQYYSMVWRQRIPKMLAQKAQEMYVIWYWNQPKNHMLWKRCSKCGQMKPAHPLFFTKNNSIDGYYSTCRDCGKRGAA